MQTSEKLNINEEYEKLVPSEKREMLFDESENYDSLRKYIINQPREVYSKKKLPFSDVKLLSYPCYKKNEIINHAKSTGKRLFFIKQSVKGKPDFCDAAGYYIFTTKKFVLLPYSYIVNKTRDLFVKDDTRTGVPDGVNLYTTSIRVFDSPEGAASYVLGQRAGLNEWVDVKGNGLDFYYKRFADYARQQLASQEDKEEENVSSNYLSSETLANKDVYHNLSTLNLKTNTQAITSNPVQLFYININVGTSTIYNAFGYYDSKTKGFILKTGSYMLEKVSSSYKYSADELRRRLLIKKYCTKELDCFRLNRDCNFMTPGQAASCVLGRAVDGWNEWRDITGKSLREFYL